MKRLIGLAAVLAVGLMVGGCDKKDAGSAGASGGSDNTGVTECDQYISKMEACFGKMDPTAKAAAEPAFKTTRDSWKSAASTPQGKESLKTTCKAMLDNFDKSMPQCK